MIKKLLSLFIYLQISVCVFAQVTYKNGNVGTGATTASAVAAPAGTEWSEAQASGTVANTNAGISGYYVNALTSDFKLGDDFVVPSGQSWSVSQVSVYGYQTGSAATPSPFDVLRVQIWNGNPSSGGTLVFGDMTTNRLSTSLDTLRYRIFNTVTPAPGTASGTTRKVWKLTANISGVTLPAGTYWLVWQVHATNDAANFCPTASVVGTRGLATWNAIQSTAGTWASVADGGNPATTPVVPQDFPFEVNYTVITPVTLSSFSGIKTQNNNQLSWATATEQNNAGFDLQRSADGAYYSSLGFVPSKAINGNSNTALNYEFSDAKPFVGNNYYRLRQTDKDGKANYSQVVLLKSTKSKGVDVSLTYPNPVQNTLNVVLTAANTEKVTIIISDVSGKILSQLATQLATGDNNIKLNVSKLAGGNYTIHAISENGNSEAKKFVKQ